MQNLAVTGGAFVDAETQIGRNQGFNAIEEEIVELGTGLAADLNGVFETCGGDQRHARAFALQQSVRADCGAVQKDSRSAPPIFSRASTIACDGSAGVEKTLSMRTCPRSAQTQSVKVPPVSMAMWRAGIRERRGMEVKAEG